MQTKCYEHIEKHGPKNTAELLEMLSTSRRANATSHELSQMLSVSPLFEKMGDELVADAGWTKLTSGYKIALWGICPLEGVAKKWLSVKHPIRKRSSLPRVLLREIERLEGEGWGQ